MKHDVWMPLYIGDYLRDTGHLTTTEHGAYLLLLMQAWTRGGSLPTDDARLRAMCRMGAKAWQGSRETILAFFVLEGGAYRHKRVSAELERATSTSSSRSMSGALGATKRWEKARENNDRPMANAILPEWQNDAQSQSQSQEEEREEPNGSSRANFPLSAGPVEPAPDARTALFREGLARVMRLTGKPADPCRRLLGKMLSEFNDDAALIGLVLTEAEQQRPADPMSWIKATLQHRTGKREGRRTNRMDSRLIDLMRYQQELSDQACDDA